MCANLVANNNKKRLTSGIANKGFATKYYRCISINYNVVEKFIYFSNSTQIVKLVY